MQLRHWLISHPAMVRAVCSENKSQHQIQDVSHVVWYSIPFHCGSYYIASVTVLYVAITSTYCNGTVLQRLHEHCCCIWLSAIHIIEQIYVFTIRFLHCLLFFRACLCHHFICDTIQQVQVIIVRTSLLCFYFTHYVMLQCS